MKPIEKALEKIPNTFLLTTVVSRRWESLVAGAPPLVEVKPGMTKIDIVLAEILEDKIEVDEETMEIRLRGEPEVEPTEEVVFSEPVDPEAVSLDDLTGNSQKD